jgi:4-amino-4-deoxy-L-arabinose transferase-like glycosyltransferase
MTPVLGRRTVVALSGLMLLHAAILFLVIPLASRSLTSFYNQNTYADGYDQLAGNLVDGHGYRFYPDTAATLMREPGFPIFLAGLFLVFGKGITAVKVANLCLAVAAAWVMARLTLRVSTNPVAVIAAPLLFLFHPGTLIAESRGGVEILFLLLLLLFVATLYRALDRRHPAAYALSGAVLGVTVLVRSTPILFPAFLLVYLWLADRQVGWARAALNVAVMIAMMCAVLSPWIVRNYRLTGRFVPTASVVGVSAHAGQYICSNLTKNVQWSVLDRAAAAERMTIAREMGLPYKEVKDGYYQHFYASVDELTFSSALMKRVMQEYRASPLLFAQCAGSNVVNIWVAGKTWRSTYMNAAVQLPYLALAVAGIAAAVRGRRFLLIAPMVLLVVYYVAVYVPILAQARYSVPLVPFLSIFGALALGDWLGRGTGARAVTA